MLRLYAANAAALKAWNDIIGYGQQPNKNDRSNGEFRRLNAETLHREGFFILPYHAAETLLDNLEAKNSSRNLEDINKILPS